MLTNLEKPRTKPETYMRIQKKIMQKTFTRKTKKQKNTDIDLQINRYAGTTSTTNAGKQTSSVYIKVFSSKNPR